MSHFIDLQTAIDMTTRYRSQRENVLVTQYRQQNLLPTCETFERSAFDTLLGEYDCKKIRIYFSMNENLQVRAIVVGVDSTDKDILPPETQKMSEQGSEVIVEAGQLCPPICPPAS